MSVQYQHGYLRRRNRKNGNSGWEIMWRDQDPSGTRLHRTTVIGTAEQYSTAELAREVARGLRMQINEARNRQPEQSIFIDDFY
ncbi:MAG: hypothetical protein ND895_16670 [Pyrinomonadaceae bacterium]|nr:hypothetical protein [Pyrinomonadaceae bacterium]